MMLRFEAATSGGDSSASSRCIPSQVRSYHQQKHYLLSSISISSLRPMMGYIVLLAQSSDAADIAGISVEAFGDQSMLGKLMSKVPPRDLEQFIVIAQDLRSSFTTRLGETHSPILRQKLSHFFLSPWLMADPYPGN